MRPFSKVETRRGLLVSHPHLSITLAIYKETVHRDSVRLISSLNHSKFKPLWLESIRFRKNETQSHHCETRRGSSLENSSKFFAEFC
jgi:hypothetical protein